MAISATTKIGFKYGTTLPASGINEGTFYVTSTGEIYLGTGSTSTLRLGDVIVVANTAALPASASERVLYYAISENTLCRYSATLTNWVQINIDANTEYKVVRDGAYIKLYSKEKGTAWPADSALGSTAGITLVSTISAATLAVQAQQSGKVAVGVASETALTYADIASLVLGGFAQNAGASGEIAASDTLATALNKLENRIDGLNTTIGNLHSFNVSVVSTLPTTGIDAHTIYFVEKAGTTNDVYEEYIYINSAWELIGNTQIDLSGYQPADGDLTAIANIAGTSGLLRKTGANTWSLDTNTYLTSETQLSGGQAATAGKYVSGVTVSGHVVTVTLASLPTVVTYTANGGVKLTGSNFAIDNAVTAKTSYAAVTLTPGTAGNIVVPIYNAYGLITGFANQAVTVNEATWGTF